MHMGGKNRACDCGRFAASCDTEGQWPASRFLFRRGSKGLPATALGIGRALWRALVGLLSDDQSRPSGGSSGEGECARKQSAWGAPRLRRYANVKLRAGIVSEAGDYAWSSAPTRLSDRDGSEFLDLAPWRRSYSPEQGRDVFESGMSEEAQLERIREATRRGRPLGTADLIQSVALQLGRALDRRKAGRPRKHTADRVETQCCLASRNGE
jgi:hypothetical protein